MIEIHEVIVDTDDSDGQQPTTPTSQRSGELADQFFGNIATGSRRTNSQEPADTDDMAQGLFQKELRKNSETGISERTASAVDEDFLVGSLYQLALGKRGDREEYQKTLNQIRANLEELHQSDPESVSPETVLIAKKLQDEIDKENKAQQELLAVINIKQSQESKFESIDHELLTGAIYELALDRKKFSIEEFQNRLQLIKTNYKTLNRYALETPNPELGQHIDQLQEVLDLEIKSRQELLKTLSGQENVGEQVDMSEDVSVNSTAEGELSIANQKTGEVIKVNNPNVAAALIAVLIFDGLFGTNNIQIIAQRVVQDQVRGWVFAKFGIDIGEFNQVMTNESTVGYFLQEKNPAELLKMIANLNLAHRENFIKLVGEETIIKMLQGQIYTDKRFGFSQHALIHEQDRTTLRQLLENIPNNDIKSWLAKAQTQT